MSFLRKVRRRVRKCLLRKKLDEALDVQRAEFRNNCHQQLDELFDELDPGSGFTKLDVFMAYAHKGYGVVSGVELIQPTGPVPETPLEERARQSGIEIVDA